MAIVQCFLAVTLLYIPNKSFSQFTISGKVINAADRQPLVKASVFLDNASVGTVTLEDGTYKIANVRPGQYDLVISSVGFETYHQSVFVSDNVVLKDAALFVKTNMLAEIKIKPNNNWERDYQTFKRLFLGTSENSQYCKIFNSNVLDFDFDTSTRVFTAKSSDFIEIENDALGYNIKYLLADLTFDTKSGISYYEGTSSFTELNGTENQKRNWKKNRLKAFQGSSMHFLRSAISNTLDGDGYQVFKVVKKPNPAYHGGFDSKFVLMLYPAPLPSADFIKKTDRKGVFALGFKDCLYIMYKKRKSKVTDTTIAHVLHPENLRDDPLVTIITFDEPYAFYDFNGIIMNPHSVIFEGEWGKRLVADLLPVDYVPEIVK